MLKGINNDPESFIVSIKIVEKSFYRCRCVWPDCRHRWLAEEIPFRCAKCKRHTWGGLDRRTRQPRPPYPPLIVKTIYQCTCDGCGHPWQSPRLARQCPLCQRRTWNGKDKRRKAQP